ncbi:hypothetical protein CC86DRAFT_293847, partial [Ophiobolus disseminans]
LQPHHIFLPTTSTLCTSLFEIDFNMHKSNSTYLTNIDTVRGYHSGVIFGPLFMPNPGRKGCNIIVAGIMCNFKREIQPYRKYETSTRVVSWGEKWIYIVTHFLERGMSAPGTGVLQRASSENMNGRTKAGTRTGKRVVFASAVTRLVCKRGRLTVPLDCALEECGFLSAVDDELERNKYTALNEMKTFRKAYLDVVQLIHGWSKVHDLLESRQAALGRFTDILCVEYCVEGIGLVDFPYILLGKRSLVHDNRALHKPSSEIQVASKSASPIHSVWIW